MYIYKIVKIDIVKTKSTMARSLKNKETDNDIRKEKQDIEVDTFHVSK